MTGDKGDATRQCAVGDGNSTDSRNSHPGGDTGYDLIFDARPPQRQHFLAAAAEDERISAFQARDDLAAARKAQYQPFYEGQRCRAASATLPHLNHAC